MSLNVKIERVEMAEVEIDRMSTEEDRMRGIYMQDGVIDDTEQDALDRIKSKIDRLRGVVARLRAEIEENKRIWEARASEWTEAQNRLQALQDFAHPDAASMATAVGDVTLAVSDQRWADATAGLDQVQTNMEHVWADYELQTAAQAEYDPMRIDLDTRLPGAEAAEPQTELIAGLLGQIRGNLSAINASVTARNYVEALGLLQTAVTELEAAEAEIIRVQEAKAIYDEALAALQDRLTDASVCEYQTLSEQQGPLLPLQGAMETAATGHDYEAAKLKLDELEIAVDAFLTARGDLDAERTAYEDKLTTLRGRLTAASVSEMPTTAELQRTIITAEDAMTAAAEAEDYAEALRLSGDVEIALEAYELIIEDRDLYLARLDAMRDELTDASVTQAKWGYLEPIQIDMAALQTDMESAATANDYATALIGISALEAKLAEFYAAITAKKLEYETELVQLDSRTAHLDDCNYPLSTEISAVQSAIAAIDADVTDENWMDALNGVASAMALLDVFDTAHAAHDATLRAQITTALPALRTAADHPDNDEISSASTLRDNIVALDRALAGTQDLDAMILVLDRATQLAADLEQIREIRDKIDVMFNADDEALEIFNEIKRNGDLKSLPLEARNMLVETLLEDGMFDSVDSAERTAVQEIWSSTVNLDPAFEAFDRTTTNEIVSSLSDDPQVQGYSANWTTMTAAEQRAAMSYIGNIIGGEDGWDVEGNEDINYTVDQGKCPTKPNLMGFHREGTDTTNEEISVCMSNTNGTWNPSADFADVVLNLAHEVGHGYQESLIDQYESEELSPGSPEYEQARMLSLDRRYFEEFPADYNTFGIYVHSPMEQQSRRTSNRMRTDLPPAYGSGHHQSVQQNDPLRST
jgi:hypothetical protein